jgi:hypothetical protein
MAEMGFGVVRPGEYDAEKARIVNKRFTFNF